jgi:hypothetical protein
MLVQVGQETNVQRPIGRTPSAATQVVRFEERGGKHWPILSATRRYRFCSARGVTRNVSVICQTSDVALCVDKKCFLDYEYHTKANP